MAYDQNSKFGELTRNLQENQLGGVIFGCNHDTIDECFRKQLFGSPSAHYSYVKNVKVGMPLFLFNYSDRKLHGIFEAASPGQMYIDPNAWIGEGSSGTAFPAQVCIVTRTQYPPLLESQFKTLLGDNYYDHHHFYFELDHAQTRALISLFKSLAPANFNQVPAVSSIRNPSVSSSPTKMKLTAVPDPKKVTANSEETNPLCVLSDRAAPFIWADDVDSASNTDEKKSEEPVARKSWWGNLDPSTVPSWLKSNWGEVERQKYFARKDDKKDISEEEDYEFEYSYGLSFPRMQENDKLSLTLPEKNIDIWRQLWRVLERSDLLVMVVDARDPLFYRCPDLEAYAKEIDEHKRTMLLVNKADLLPLNIRKRWAEYFKAQDILYVFWSAKAAAATLESKKLSGYSEEETASLDLDTKVYGRDELLMRLQAEAESIVAQRKTSTAKEHHDVSSSHSVSSVTKHVVVGFVGYPNVGKSSTINALFGERTGVTHTPGKIKLTLYDYPGTILPCFSISRNELSQEEIQIDQLAIINLCKKVAKGLDVVQVSRTKNKLALVSTDVIYRLKSLAEDIRIWMQWSSAFDMQILYNLYISIGKKIVQNNNKQAKITERPKEMICDLERLASELYTRKRLFMNMNGQMVRVFHRESLARTMEGHQGIIDCLKLLFDELGQSDPRLSLIVCGQLEIPIWDYKYHLDTALRSAMKTFKSADVPAQNGVWFRPPDTTKIFETIDKVAGSLPRPRKPAATIVNSDSASSAKKFLQIVSDTRQQSALKFVREVNPLFKGVKDLISEALDPKCIGCFERNGYYFTTCCEIILCRSCAEKNTAFICKEVHKLGVNLHFPIILSKPVGK